MRRYRLNNRGKRAAWLLWIGGNMAGECTMIRSEKISPFGSSFPALFYTLHPNKGVMTIASGG
jgi:hypothetical protein